jgi:RNA polymerase sigma-70 factor (ECF subfamily)
VIPWNDLVDDLGPVVYRIALRIVGHAADAEDVVQDVFLEVHRLWQARTVENWSGLVSSLAVRRSLDLVRKRKVQEPLPEQLFDPSNADPAGLAAGHELQELVRRTIARLPPQQAEVFSLYFLDQRSHHEIAEIMHISTHAVAASLHKARMRIESELQNHISSKAR